MSDAAFGVLGRLARQERRPVRDQAAVLLEQALTAPAAPAAPAAAQGDRADRGTWSDAEHVGAARAAAVVVSEQAAHGWDAG